MPETDLYPPVRRYLEQQGYHVQAEVQDCDVTATKDGELVVVELKQQLSLRLLAQACDRQRLTEAVYVAVPQRPERDVLHLLRRLELGLLVVHLAGAASWCEMALHPLPHPRRRQPQRRRTILRELAERPDSPNIGGSQRHQVVTAWRELGIFIAVCLDRYGAQTPAQLRALGTGPKTTSILGSRLNRQWFERVDRGLYTLRPTGRAKLAKYPALVAKYRLQLAAGAGAAGAGAAGAAPASA